MKHHLLQEAHGWNVCLLLHCWRQFVLVTVFRGGREDMDNHQLFDVISNWIRCSSVWGWGVPLIGKEITSACFLLHVANLTLFSWNLPSAQQLSLFFSGYPNECGLCRLIELLGSGIDILFFLSCFVDVFTWQSTQTFYLLWGRVQVQIEEGTQSKQCMWGK